METIDWQTQRGLQKLLSSYPYSTSTERACPYRLR